MSNSCYFEIIKVQTEDNLNYVIILIKIQSEDNPKEHFSLLLLWIT